MLPTVIRCEVSPTVISPAPNAAIATSSGRSMPSSEPKAANRMMPAATTPISSVLCVEPSAASLIAWPPSSTCTPASRAA